MTPEQQRILIAEACGLLNLVGGSLVHRDWCAQTKAVFEMVDWSDGTRFPRYIPVPDYPADLNACHEMEKSLTDDERKEYSFILCGYSSDDLRADLLFDEIHTPAAQRAVAFLKAKKLWADTP